jgi:hypothetical protein
VDRDGHPDSDLRLIDFVSSDVASAPRHNEALSATGDFEGSEMGLRMRSLEFGRSSQRGAIGHRTFCVHLG